MAFKPCIFSSFGAIDTARLAHRGQLHGDSPRAIASLVLPEKIADQGHQFTVSLFAGGFALSVPSVVTRAADQEDVADSCHRKRSLESYLFHESIDIGYALRLKMANAFFRMSRSRSTRRSSSWS